MLGRTRLAVIAAVALGALVSASAASAAPGELDPSFGTGGVINILPSEEEFLIRGVAVQPDDKIVLAGGEQPGNVVLLRLLPNGELDPSFGVGGKVVTAFPGGYGYARAVAIQPDGKIVVAGEAKGTANGDFLIARYTSGGAPDPSFGGGDGMTILPVGTEEDEAEAVAIGPEGKIAAVGTAKNGNQFEGGVAVVLANGAPDTGFAGDGTTTFKTPPGNDRPDSVAMLPDGRVLIGDASGAGGGLGFTIVQLLPTAAPDPSFGGGDGVVQTPIPAEGVMGGFGRVTDIARLGDGRIVASGYGFDYSGSPPSYDSKVAAARYLEDGELDPGFGSGGIFTRQLPGEDEALTVDVAEGGKLLLAGVYEDPASGTGEPFVMRLDPGGSLDPSFGTGGIVLRGQTALFGEALEGAAIDSQDRLVTLGTAYVGNNTTVVVVTRYLGDPRPKPSNRPPHARMKKVPRTVAAERLKGFSGSAGDPDGEALSKVQIALVKLLPGGARASRRAAPGCLVLRNRSARLRRVRVRKGSRCPQRWLASKGTVKWSFRLKRGLPPGRYVVYARAIDEKGLAESDFSRRAGNRYAFRVAPSR